MTTIPIPWQVLALFYLKKALFLFVVPILIGFLVSVLYPLAQRAAAQHRGFVRVMLIAALGPTCMLFGWTMVVRTIWTAPMYGLGYGLGVALMSRVHSIKLFPFRVTTRRGAFIQEAKRRAEEQKDNPMTHFCNKCGYLGRIERHPNCKYSAAPMRRVQPTVTDWQLQEAGRG